MRLSIIVLILAFVFSCSNNKDDRLKLKSFSAEEASTEKPDTIRLKTLSTEKVKVSVNSLTVFSGKVKIEVPVTLKPMDVEMFKLKYPMENPATTIAYSNEDATVTLLISPRRDKATQADLPKYQRMLYGNFGRNPSIDFKKSEIRKINGRDFIVLEMVTPAVDTQVYNLMFVTSLEGKLLMISFNCTIDSLKEWQPIADQIFGSLKVNVKTQNDILN